MAHLIDDLLDVSRVTQGLVKLETEDVDIRSVVAEAIEQSTPHIQARGHQLSVHTVPDMTLVVDDKKRLVQIVTNLINNAAKYTPPGESVAVDMQVDIANVVIHVTDSGMGIDDELLPRVFDLFSQAKIDSARSTGGLGVGLALVKSLTELHGGSVHCESLGPDAGSRFTVSLPRTTCVTASSSPKVLLASRSLQKSRPLSFLIVDDNVDAAETTGC